MSKLPPPVVEWFGPTVQGEGDLIGVQTHFVRFGFCDFKCVWCDSMHAVDPQEARKNSVRLSAMEIVSHLLGLPGSRPPWVTLSGGNPAIHDLQELIQLLHSHHFKVAIETQGTICPEWIGECDQITISPKPPSAGMGDTLPLLDRFMRTLLKLVRRGGQQISFKVPVFDEADYAYAVEVYATQKKPWMNFHLQVGNSNPGNPSLPELVDRLKWLTQLTLDRGDMPHARVLPQLHVLLWGNELGR